MTMTKMRDVAVLALILCVPLAAAFVYLAPDTAAYAAGTPDGRQIFLAQRCDLCHAVPAAGIAAVTAVATMQGPRIDGLAARHDADWLKNYLAQHKELKSTDAEADALASWLLEQEK